ncbi:MAG: TAXI family TRAP transporter solute-binding subunit [Magnetococcales bacterium]|nr:TAXI family TRAP transporter solute-binding subunit [Magnetococcales bacterium]
MMNRIASCRKQGKPLVIQWIALWLMVMGTWCAMSEPQARERLVVASATNAPLMRVAANALCRLTASEEDFSCRSLAAVDATDAIDLLRHGKVHFAIVSSRDALRAWTGAAPFNGKVEGLRLVFRLHPEAVVLVGRKDAAIGQLKDIFEKRVNIGPAGSEIEQWVLDLMVACQVWPSDLLEIRREDLAAMPGALHEGRIDAFFVMGGHPARVIGPMGKQSSIDLVPLNDPCIDGLIKNHPSVRKMVIEGKTYPGIIRDVPTFGTDALLLTHAEVSPKLVGLFAEFLLRNIDDFRQRHSAFAPIDRKTLRLRFPIPHHRGMKGLVDP